MTPRQLPCPTISPRSGGGLAARSARGCPSVVTNLMTTPPSSAQKTLSATASRALSTPYFLLATFLQRHLAPHLAPTISALVRAGQHGPTAATPTPPGAGNPGTGPRRPTSPVQTPQTHPTAPPTPPSASPPADATPNTGTVVFVELAAPYTTAHRDSAPNAALAASTSAPAELGAVAGGTA